MPVDIALVKKGSNVPLDGLLDQARASKKLATDHSADVAPWGFGLEDAAGFQPLIDALDTKEARAADARALGKQNTVTERQALSRAKKWKRIVISAADTLTKKKKMTAADRAALNVGETIDRNTTRASAYLGRIKDVIGRYNDALKPFVGGMDPAAELAAAKAELDTAQTVQETGADALPVETQVHYENKGKLLDLIEDLNAAASRAFDGDAVKKALFNKDLILRAVTPRKPKTPTPA